MNGFPLNQFVLGFALARPLAERRDQFMVALSASMLSPNNPLGPIFLKPQVDAWSAREADVAALQQQLAGTKTSLDAADVLLQLAGTPWAASQRLAFRAAPSTSPALQGTQDIKVTSDQPGVADIAFDPKQRTITINRMAPQRAAGAAEITVTFAIEAAGRKLSVVRTLLR